MNTTTEVEAKKSTLEHETGPTGRVRRKKLTGMLSAALCSHTRKVGERRGAGGEGSIPIPIPILRRTWEVGGREYIWGTEVCIVVPCCSLKDFREL